MREKKKTAVMGREKRSRNLVRTILDVSRDLFLKHGYRETTIRQIIEKVGIKNGTLYHFFKDKEDILCHVCLKTYNEYIGYVDSVTEDADVALQYAVTRALEFKIIEEDDMIARLYEEAYTSWRVAEVLKPINMERNKNLFHRFNPSFTDHDYLNRTLALRGMRALLISDRVHSGPGRFSSWCPFAIETAFVLFNVPKNEIDRSISKALAMVSEHDIVSVLINSERNLQDNFQ